MGQSKGKILLIGLILVVVFCGYSWWSAGTKVKRSVANNRHLLNQDIHSFVFWRGESAFRSWLSVEAKTNEALTYDGQNRFAYVIRCTNPLYDGNSDKIKFAQIGGPDIGMLWTGSRATRICSVNILEDSVEIGVAAEENPKQELNLAVLPWQLIESESGTGRLRDYFKN